MGGPKRARPRASRGDLVGELLELCRYRNAAEWNRAVALCETLAEVGWGDHEAIEAVRGTFYNGNPTTRFVNRFGEPRFVDAIWSQRKDGLTMEPGRTSYHASPELPRLPTVLWDHPVTEEVQDLALATQRNWIPKNPIAISRGIANCYEANEPLIEAIEALQATLDREMRPERYGPGLQRIRVVCHFSHDDGPHNRCNYVPVDEPKPLGRAALARWLAGRYTAKEIADNGYFARNRMELGRFNRATATLRVDLHFGRELAELDDREQRRRFAAELERAIDAALDRLGSRAPGYDVAAMRADVAALLERFKQ